MKKQLLTNAIIEKHQEERSKLFGSLLLFTQTFYKLRTGRTFNLSRPIGRESHYITICRALMRVFRGEIKRLLINIPPRYGKTELLIHFVAWGMARHPDSNFLYVSYSHHLAATQTATIRDILTLLEYQELFCVKLQNASQAKFDFKTNMNGSVYAAGTGGTIAGYGAGIKGCLHRFSGAIVIDDAHKPDEAQSDVIREGVIEWYRNTLQSRRNNGKETPIICIGQITRENDLSGYLKEIDNEKWDVVSLPALDGAGNALDPDFQSKEFLEQLQKTDPYNFAAQYQQRPEPAGGGLFKTEWFPQLPECPKLLTTFITVDTAETNKDYNDATVFSFWGLYEIKIQGHEMGEHALHWLDCQELRIEAAELEDALLQFYFRCLTWSEKPQLIAIEKKSTGVTLTSVLQKLPGLFIHGIERTKASGCKTARFIEMQHYIATRRITFTENASHVQMCIEHMSKITANNTHAHDDICDTAYDAIKLGLIDNSVLQLTQRPNTNKRQKLVNKMMASYHHIQSLRSTQQWQN